MTSFSTSALTPEGRARLQAELQHLRTVGRAEVAERLRRAREQAPGEWGENPAVLEARRDAELLEARIAQIEEALALAEATTPAAAEPGVVQLGSTVTVRDDDGTIESYTLVGSAEAEPRRGRISIASPIGRALVGHRAGEQVVAETPSGPRRLEIIAVE